MADNEQQPSPAELEATVASLRRELAAAAPRLEAFDQLERMANDRGVTPETIALQAAIEGLDAERTQLASEVEQLAADCDAHKRESQVLVEEKEEITILLDGAQRDHADLVNELGELLDELDAIRSDAVRLLGEKAQLEMEVAALRNEVAGLRSGGDDVVVSAPTPTLDQATFDTIDDPDEESAFDRFFHAEIGTDKARDWMLK